MPRGEALNSIKALHWTGIPLRSIPASELRRYGKIVNLQQ
jgi:hypothetical protein